MGEPENHTLQLLKKLRDEMREGFAKVEARFAALEGKFEKRSRDVEKRVDAVKQMAYAETILSRYAVIDVEGRLMRIEDYLKLRDDAGAPL
jgi:parvulin-like peptidyl-prolyl isomerase